MASRSSSFMSSAALGGSVHAGLSVRRPSVSSRRSFAVSATSTAERGENGESAPAAVAEHQQIEEEIAEIKRYEDFTTIDWVQDAAREQLRRKARRQRNASLYDHGQAGWRHKLYESYDAAQGWIVVTLIGVAIGLNAAFLNIITEWLSDIKLGYCTTAFYLNENFCCWGEDNGCEDWHRWTSFEPINYVLYLIFATAFAFTTATLVRSYAPYAAGSGISEIKCIIAGFTMKGFLGFWTLAIKSIALPLAIASGLSVGKEGPSVHYAVCTGNVISRMFAKYRRNASKTREILCACAAAGVGVAFGSPIGGVLFSLEEMASYFPLKTLWRSYFCALVATAVLSAMNPFRTGQLVMFQVHYDRSWHFFETVFYIIIGIFGGLYGAFVIKWNLRVQAFRKKYLSQHAVLEATLLAAATAIVCYPNVFLRIDMTESMEILFLECEGAEDYQGLCEAPNRAWNIASLVVATLLRTFLVIISYGCKVPAGIFVPSMAIGASFGRTVGIIVQALHEAYPSSVFFSACEPDVPCITPGTYAFLGAAAALSGIMHLTVSVVVIMFELTGALTYILPTMIVVGVTKAVSDLFGKGGIADRMIWFSGFPFLDNKEEHNFGVPVSQAMNSDVTALPASGMTLASVDRLLAQGKYQGYPVVEDAETRVLVGYVGRTELRYAVDRFRRSAGPLNPDTRCLFVSPTELATTTAAAGVDGPLATPMTPALTVFPDMAAVDTSSQAAGRGVVSPHSSASATATAVDFSRYVDRTPVTVHPKLPLETVMELFRKIGPRVILIEHHGKLTGLVTVKDCLKYQFKAEAAENTRTAGANGSDENGHGENQQEQLWLGILWVAGWVSDRISRMTGGRIHLGNGHEGYGGANGGNGGRGSGDHTILDGTEDVDDEGVELDTR
ncbi:glycerol ethanol, ferric requiring protein [Sporothrix eucalyptigena]